jgi:Gpi18-like mannosyltransferase
MFLAWNTFKQNCREPFWQIWAGMFLLEAVFVPSSSYTPDRIVIIHWAQQVRDHGIGLAYQAAPPYNYPPLMAYTLWLFAKLIGNDANLERYFHFYKLFPLACDFAAAALVASFAGDRRREILCLLLLIANPVFIYDSYYWGQTDSVYGALVLFSLVLALREQPCWALLAYLLALNFKVQALVYAPLLALVFCGKWRNPWTPRQVGVALGASALAQFIIFLPFLLAGQLAQMFRMLRQAVGYYPIISLNAYNFWHLFYGRHSLRMDDALPVFAGLSARLAGEMLFCALLFAVLLPCARQLWLPQTNRRAFASDQARLYLLFALITLFFFYFCTESHERFAQPALLFVAAYAFQTHRYYLLALVMLPYGLNVEYVLRRYQFDFYDSLLFDSRFVAALYAVAIIVLLALYFRTPSKVPAPAS